MCIRDSVDSSKDWIPADRTTSAVRPRRGGWLVREQRWTARCSIDGAYPMPRDPLARAFEDARDRTPASIVGMRQNRRLPDARQLANRTFEDAR